jgi:phage terminase small subunit
MPATAHSGGRNKKPASLHVLQGTFRGRRHDPGTAPDLPAGIPDPRDLSGEARAEFDRMVKRLTGCGTLTTVDDAALRLYALLHAQVDGIQAEHRRLGALSRRLMKALERLEGRDLVDATRELVQLEKLAARQLQQLRQGSMALRQWLVEFGMTPSARTRVTTTPGTVVAAPDPKKARFLSGLTQR